MVPRALRTPVRLKTLLSALLLAVAALLVVTGVASADLFTPEDGGSPNADTVDDLYKLTLALAVVVFVGVEGALVYSLIKFRTRKGAVPAQIRGNTRLEVGFTVASALVLVVLAVVTFAQLSNIRNAPSTEPNGFRLATAGALPQGTGGNERPADAETPAGNADNAAFPEDGSALRIAVNGQQYVWRYTYPDGDDNALNNVFSYEELVVPTDTTITLEITAQDVIHSWWIPELGGKFDAVPGHTNYTWFKIPGRFAGQTFQTGRVFRGQCAELCGRNHANMVAHVRAISPEQFRAWLASKRREIDQANNAATQQRRQFEREAEQAGAEESTRPTTP